MTPNPPTETGCDLFKKVMIYLLFSRDTNPMGRFLHYIWYLSDNFHSISSDNSACQTNSPPLRMSGTSMIELRRSACWQKQSLNALGSFYVFTLTNVMILYRNHCVRKSFWIKRCASYSLAALVSIKFPVSRDKKNTFSSYASFRTT